MFCSLRLPSTGHISDRRGCRRLRAVVRFSITISKFLHVIILYTCTRRKYRDGIVSQPYLPLYHRLSLFISLSLYLSFLLSLTLFIFRSNTRECFEFVYSDRLTINIRTVRSRPASCTGFSGAPDLGSNRDGRECNARNRQRGL